MVKILNYIKAQDKVKLLIYLYGFSFFVLINNVFINAFFIVGYQDFWLEVFCTHCKVPINTPCVSEIVLFLVYKSLIFISLNRLLKNQNKICIDISEIFIILFLFDLGFLTSQIIDAFAIIKPKLIWDFCSSPQTMLIPMIGWPFATVISLFWTIALGILLKRHNKFSPEFILKRCFVILFSLATFNITTRLIFFLILKPLGIHL